MKKFFIIMQVIFIFFMMMTLYICFSDVTDKSVKVEFSEPKKVKTFLITGKLPENLIWQDGSDQETFASSKAKKGGNYRDFINVFPKTLRQVGPESNSGFRSYLEEQDMSLVSQHPKTGKFYPSLAVAWAIAEDNRTVYFKLDKNARWGDGQKVLADDYVFSLIFFRSPSLLAPWYNDFFSRDFEEIIKIDDYTIGVRLRVEKPDLLYNCNISPLPYHFYGNFRRVKKSYSILQAYEILKRDKVAISTEIEKKYQQFKSIKNPTKEQIELSKIEIEINDVVEDFVNRYDWVVPPKTGAYYLASYAKGDKVVFLRLKDWWAKEKKFYKNRYNVDSLTYTVIRDINSAFDIFAKGDLDSFQMTLPPYWHIKSKEVFEWEYLGYMTRLWYYNDIPRPSYLLSMNMDKPLLKEYNIRLGIVHSLNFSKMIKRALKSDYEQAQTIATGYDEYSHNELKARNFDINQARKYFAKAGFNKLGADGILRRGEERLSIELLYGFEGHTERLLVLKEEAMKAGFELKLKNGGGQAAFTQMLAKKHHLAWHGWSTNLRPSYWGQYHGDNASVPNNNNFTNMNDPEVNKLINTYRSSIDSQDRIKLSRQIQEKIHNLASAIPTIVVPYFRQSYWNWFQCPQDIGKRVSSITDYGLFWIDAKKKDKILSLKKKFKKYETNKPAVQIINKPKFDERK